MGKFKQFMLNEEFGLANLGNKINTLFHSEEFDRQVKGAMTAIDRSELGRFPTEGNGLDAPYLQLPSVTRQGVITCLDYKRNPIYVSLSDGTEAHFTYDEYKRISGNPAVGKTMIITFQRHPKDNTQQSSKIERCEVL